MNALEKRIANLESKIDKLSKPKTKRKPSKYNDFIGKTITSLKKKNPSKYSVDGGHSIAFADAVDLWNAQKK